MQKARKLEKLNKVRIEAVVGKKIARDIECSLSSTHRHKDLNSLPMFPVFIKLTTSAVFTAYSMTSTC